MTNAVKLDETATAAFPIAEGAGARTKKLAEALRKFGPYLTVAIFVPGGMVLAPVMWYARRRAVGAP
jgi:hypothetical protein